MSTLHDQVYDEFIKILLNRGFTKEDIKDMEDYLIKLYTASPNADILFKYANKIYYPKNYKLKSLAESGNERIYQMLLLEAAPLDIKILERKSKDINKFLLFKVVTNAGEVSFVLAESFESASTTFKAKFKSPLSRFVEEFDTSINSITLLAGGSKSKVLIEDI